MSKSDYDSELEAKEYPIKEGLSVIDASLLAWSLALLGIDDLPTLGNEDPKMVLSALANRCKRMLKSRKDSLFSENIDFVISTTIRIIGIVVVLLKFNLKVTSQ